MSTEAVSPKQSSETVVITDKQRTRLLVTNVVGHGIKHALNAIFPVLVPEIKNALDLTNAQVGLLTTTRQALGGIANLPAGYAGDRYGKQRAGILGLCLALIGVFSFVIGVATGYWMLLVGAAMVSIVTTFWHPSGISSLARQFVTRRGFAIGLHGTGGSVGEAIGPLLAGALLTYVSWRTIMQGSIVPAIISGVAVWVVLKTIPAQGGGAENIRIYTQGLRRLFRNKKLLLILAFAAGFGGGQATIMTFFPVYLREDLGYDSGRVGLYIALAQVVGIAAQPLMGYLSDRLSRKAVMVPSLLALGITSLALGASLDGWLLVVVVLVMGGFLFSLMSIFLASASDLVDATSQATTVSMVFGVSVIVSAIVPYIAGTLADIYGVQVAFICAAAVVLTAAALATVTNWQANKPA